MNDDQINALYKYLLELQACLNYQPEIPHQHKVDMNNRLHQFIIECGFKTPQQPEKK